MPVCLSAGFTASQPERARHAWRHGAKGIGDGPAGVDPVASPAAAVSLLLLSRRVCRQRCSGRHLDRWTTHVFLCNACRRRCSKRPITLDRLITLRSFVAAFAGSTAQVDGYAILCTNLF
jgi:hypothetical protein